MFNMVAVMVVVILLSCYLLIQNGDVYMAAKLSCQQIAKLDDLYFLLTYFKPLISYIIGNLEDKVY